MKDRTRSSKSGARSSKRSAAECFGYVSTMDTKPGLHGRKDEALSHPGLSGDRLHLELLSYDVTR